MHSLKHVGLLVAVSILLTGCAGTQASPQAADAPADKAAASEGHSMSHEHTPGMDMSGMKAGDEPSEAAKMVCKHVTLDAVNRLAAPDATLDPKSDWDGETFTCTYDVPAGPIELSVHDATDPAVGKKHFEQLQASTEGAEPLGGMAGFGLPAFETEDGIVSFLKDGKTLRVDTTELESNETGPEGYSRNLLAYELAATVVACWK